MQLFHSYSDFTCEKNTVVTLGTFDGLHLGHQQIVSKLVDRAREFDLESLVLTFSNHPRTLLQQDNSLKLLTTTAEKIHLLEKSGIDNVVIQPFTSLFSSLSGEEFVKTILIDHFKMKRIIIGYDHRFGKNRSSDIQDLIAFGVQYGFEVEQISAKELHEISISSTKIRTALEDGNIVLANEYLGYSYFFSGKVVEGRKLGHTLGFPTANLSIEETNKLLPKKGVYVISCMIEGNLTFGMMNIGDNPTIEGANFSIEAHFFDYNGNLYDKNIEISVLTRIRDEKKFESIAALQQQLEQDKMFALNFIS